LPPSTPAGATRSGELILIEVKAGDRVLFAKWCGAEVMIDDGEYLKESDARGILIDTEARKKAA
jgi:chaperonin GroES